MENWEQINAVQQMQSYIEEHLDEPITLHALAKKRRLLAMALREDF